MLYRFTDKDIDKVGRLIRAEAVGEGVLGMLLVGNVINNRLIVNCIEFEPLRTLNDVIYFPNAFAAINSPLFVERATTKEKGLAKRSLKGERNYPASNALWFYAPRAGEPCRPTWFNQQRAGSYKNHCFYRPEPGLCQELN